MKYTYCIRILSGLLLLTSGCSGLYDFLPPMDDARLPARAPLVTRGGYQLEIGPNGNLVSRPRQGDIEGAMGVGLEEDGGPGVRVGNLLTTETTLQVNDRILWAYPRRKDSDADLQEALESGEARGRNKAESEYRLDPAGNIRTHGHQVASIASLRGYELAHTQLDLLLERNGEELLVTLEVGRPYPVAQQVQSPAQALKSGMSTCYVDSLPEALQPANVPRLLGSDGKDAGEPDLLVTYVAVDSPYGRAGVRPLDVISRRGPVDLLRSLPDDPQFSLFRDKIYHPDGEVEDMDYPGLPKRYDSQWFETVLKYEGDHRRKAISVGPWGRVFHYHHIDLYNRRTDRYGVSRNWSILSLFSSRSISGDGQNDFTEVELDPALVAGDTARTGYFNAKLEE